MPTGHRANPNLGWLRVAFEGTNLGTDWAVVHWFATHYGTEPTVAQLNTLVDDIAAAYGTNFVNQGHISSDVVLTTVKASLAIADMPGKLRTVRVADVVGTGAGPAEAGQVCYLINWQTTDGRRGGKARSYIPGPRVADLSDQGHLIVGVANALTDFANAYHNAVNALAPAPFDSVHFIDASFVDGKAYRTIPVGYEIFAGVCSPVVATQRRRVDRLRGG